MSTRISTRIGTLLLLAMCALLGACSDDPAQPAPAPADLDAFFAGLPPWETFSPPQPDADEPVGEPVSENVTIGEDQYVETVTPYSTTRTPEKIITLNPDVEVLWVGSLLQGDGFVGGIGSLAELPIRQRAPLTISIDVLTGDNTRVVEDPDAASVRQSVGELIQAAADAGHQAGSDIYYTTESTHSVNQASLQLGLSASYMGASAQSSLSAYMSEESRTVTAYFVQRMFTVSMVLPQTPAEVFSEAFTEDRLAEQVDRDRMGPGNLPVFVSSIVYGRILLFTFTSTAMESDITSTLNAMYNGGQFGTNLSVEQQGILANAHISVVAVGGDAEYALSLIETESLGEFFTSDATITSARPISYTVRNLTDNTIARVSETTSYDLREYVPVELVATGARFRIKPFRLRGVDFPTIDTGPHNPPSDWHNAEIYYNFDVRDASGLTQSVEFEPTFLRPYAESIGESENHALENTDGTGPRWVEVDIHFDGRDVVRIVGDVWDDDLVDADDRFAQFNIRYEWPANRLRAGTYSKVRGDRWGNDVRLYWHVERLETLYD